MVIFSFFLLFLLLLLLLLAFSFSFATSLRPTLFFSTSSLFYSSSYRLTEVMCLSTKTRMDFSSSVVHYDYTNVKVSSDLNYLSNNSGYQQKNNSFSQNYGCNINLQIN